jgi:hypothetical protein
MVNFEDLWINDVHVHVNPFSKLKKPAFDFFSTNPDFRENWKRLFSLRSENIRIIRP